MRRVGTVASIHLYPVKSMRGCAVREARAYWYGLNGDRKYAFVRADVRSGFPWLTGRELPELLTYRPAFEKPDDPYASPVTVTTPTGEALPVESAALLEDIRQRYGGELSLMNLKRGAYDAMPVSLVTTATLEAIAAKLGHALNPQRFRSNLVLEAEESERAWRGKSLVIGEVRLFVACAIPRCVMINLDPQSAAHDPAYLKGVVQNGKAEVGVYASPQALGALRVGDEVWVEE